MQADWPVRKAGRNRIAIAIKGDQTRGRHALAQFDKAIEGYGQLHQREFLSLPDIGKYHQDNLFILITFPDGSLGTINYLSNGNRNVGKEYIEVFCGGKIGILDDFRSLTLSDDHNKKTIRSRVRQDKGHGAAWDVFIKAIKTGGKEPISYNEIIQVSYATLACQESLNTGEPVTLSEFITT